MKIETWPIDRPKDYPKNARKWSARAIETVAASIREYGWRQPIVVDSAEVIAIGHLRRAAGKHLGLSECPVHVASDLTPAQIRGLRLADNRTSEESAWDLDLLRVEMGDLKVGGFDLSLTGFTAREIDGFTLASNPAEDDVPPVPANPVTRAGDLWLLGPHRVLCGDATSPEDVERLLNGTPQPFLMVTDPPYGVEYDPEWRVRAAAEGHLAYARRRIGVVANDDRTDWSEAWRLFPGDVVYSWSPAGSNCIVSGGALLAAGFSIRNMIIWSKPHFPIGRGNYHYRHEPCWYAIRKGKTAHWRGGRAQTTIWEVALDNNVEGGHSTQKPVELMRRPILNHTAEGETTYDPFLGSGTTIAAAETTGRVCSGLEIEPTYTDVIVLRWQNLTGKQATLAGDNRTFAQVQAERCAVVSSETNGRKTKVRTDAGGPRHGKSDGRGRNSPRKHSEVLGD